MNRYEVVYDYDNNLYQLVSEDGVVVSFNSPEHAAEDHAFMRQLVEKQSLQLEEHAAGIIRLRELLKIYAPPSILEEI